MRHLYSLVFYLLLPLVFLRLLYRSLREPGYRQAPWERLGFAQRRAGSQEGLLWVHAVSAGEMVAAAPLVERLLAEGRPCLVTNMTPTGRARCQSLLGDRVQNCYAPYDLPGSVRRFLRRMQPEALIVIDTELWPNIMACCARQGVRRLLVNGRLSARSAARYARLPSLSRPMMAALDALGVQTEAQAARFIALGARPEKVQVTGSIKFDGKAPKGLAAKTAALRKRLCGLPALLGASTHPGEEAALLAAYGRLAAKHPQLALILAPRHTQRTAEVRQLIAAAGHESLLFSKGGALASAKAGRRPVLLVDVMGELDACYAVSDLAFVGGSLAPVGGHNLLEAVRGGAAVLMGPHLHNLDDIATQFIDAKAMTVVQSAEDLAEALARLLNAPASRKAMAKRALAILARNQGALERTLALVNNSPG